MSASCNRVFVCRTRRSVARRFRTAMIHPICPSDVDPVQIRAFCPVPHAATLAVHPPEPFGLTLDGNDEDTAAAATCDDGARAARRTTLRSSGVLIHARPRAAVA